MFLDQYFKVENKGAKVAITIAEIFLLYKGVKWGKGEYDYWKAQKDLEKQMNTPTAPGGTYQLPGGDPVSVGTFNPYLVSTNIYNAYNPGGWSTDEYKMAAEISKVPPNQFKLVAVEYAKRGRNLINDLDEQLTGVLAYPWSIYKAELAQFP